MTQTTPTDFVPLPPGIRELLLLRVPEENIAHWAVEAIVVEAAREHIISRRKAATVMGLTNQVDREAFFDRHGLTNEYTLEMVEDDFNAIAVLEDRRQSG